MISPLDIRQQQFGRSLRGYDTDEVKAYLKSLAQEWEKVLEDNKRLQMELNGAKANMKRFEDMEAMLHKTLLQAEETSKTTIEQAKAEAELIRKKASQEADDVLSSIKQRQFEMHQKVLDLEQKHNSMVRNLQRLLSGHLDELKAYEKNAASTKTESPTNHTLPKAEPPKSQNLADDIAKEL